MNKFVQIYWRFSVDGPKHYGCGVVCPECFNLLSSDPQGITYPIFDRLIFETRQKCQFGWPGGCECSWPGGVRR